MLAYAPLVPVQQPRHPLLDILGVHLLPADLAGLAEQVAGGEPAHRPGVALHRPRRLALRGQVQPEGPDVRPERPGIAPPGPLRAGHSFILIPRIRSRGHARSAALGRVAEPGKSGSNGVKPSFVLRRCAADGSRRAVAGPGPGRSVRLKSDRKSPPLGACGVHARGVKGLSGAWSDCLPQQAAIGLEHPLSVRWRSRTRSGRLTRVIPPARTGLAMLDVVRRLLYVRACLRHTERCPFPGRRRRADRLLRTYGRTFDPCTANTWSGSGGWLSSETSAAALLDGSK